MWNMWNRVELLWFHIDNTDSSVVSATEGDRPNSNHFTNL